MSSPKDTFDKSPSPDAGKDGSSPASAKEKNTQHYFPEDERSPMEKEDDHSHTDFDLEREIERKLSEKAAQESFSVTQEHFHDPDDIRPCYEGEGDHSTSDIDLDAEIEAKLGKAPEDVLETPAAASPEPVFSDHDEDTEPYDPHEHFHDTDDIRPCFDGEEDHSTLDFDLDAEIDAQLKKREAERAAFASAQDKTVSSLDEPSQNDAHPDIHLEDERSPMDWEDDHSHADAVQEIAGTAPVNQVGIVPPDINDDSPPYRPEACTEDDCVPLERENAGQKQTVGESGYLSDASGGTVDGSLYVTGEQAAGHQAETVPDVGVPGSKEEHADGMHPDLAASFAAFGAFNNQGELPESVSSSQNGVVSPEVNDDSLPTSKPEICTDDDCAPMNAENADGSLSESGYLSEATAGAVAGSLYAENETAEEETTESMLRDRPLEQATSDNGKNDASPATAEESDITPAQASDTDNVADDDEAASRTSPPVAAAGDGGNGGKDDDLDEEDDGDDQPMSLRDHLRELRKRLLRAFLWMLGGFLICYPFDEKLFSLLMQPLIKTMPKTSHFIFTNPPEAFFTYLKVAFVAGVFLSSPMVFYQIWAFIAPGLYKEEKVYIIPVAVFSALFFISGGAFCYFIGLPFVFEFFMSYNTGLIQAMPSLKETLSFVLQLLLAFGLVFELPLFIFFLARLGIVTADMMRRFRRYSILVNVIVAAVLTPPDVISQGLMAGPLIILYEISILIAAAFGKKKPKDDEEKDTNEDNDEEDEDDAAPSVPAK